MNLWLIWPTVSSKSNSPRIPMSILETFVATQIFAFLIVFARIGAALMTMPGIGDATVPAQVRLYFALVFSFVLVPVLQPFLIAPPTQPVAFGLLIIKEMLTGVFIGLMSHIMLNAINLAGVFVAHATSLSSAFTFNPQMSSQITVVHSFLSLLTVTLIFVSDMHRYLFMGLIDSYRLFPMADGLPYGDMTLSLAQGIGYALRIGLMVAAPFIVVSFGIFVAMGLVARLVPQIQVFIMSVPVQVMTGLILLMTSISAMMLYFMNEYETFWRNFLAG